MGVPGLYSNLRTTHPKAFKDPKTPIHGITHVYIDGNAMLYPIAEQTKDPIKIAHLLCDVCESYAKQYKCTVSIYMDGPAHMGKIRQQRSRRFMYGPVSVVDKIGTNVEEGIPWSPAMFSPGTTIMGVIDTEVRNILHKYPSITIYSSYNEPFEGEHKIIQHIRTICDKPYTFAIVGKDADLILLCMGLIETTDSKAIPYIIRHDDRQMKDGYRPSDPLMHIECTTLRTSILAGMSNGLCIWDFIIALFICGNDFLPPIPEFANIRDTMPLLMKHCTNMYNVGSKSTCYINWDGVHTYIQSMYDGAIGSKKIRDVVGEWLYGSSVPIDTFPNFYYDVVHPFPVDQDRLCMSWYTTIGWNVLYYHDGIDSASIAWQYQSTFSPTIHTLLTHPCTTIDQVYKVSSEQYKPLTPSQALVSILPMWLRDLIPTNSNISISKYRSISAYFPYTFKLSHYLDEPMIPFIPYEVVVSTVK